MMKNSAILLFKTMELVQGQVDSGK